MTSLDDVMRAADSFKAYAAQQKDMGECVKLATVFVLVRYVMSEFMLSLMYSHVMLCSRSVMCAPKEPLEGSM